MRERLRARHLTLLAYLATDSYDRRDYRAALDYALDLLGNDACARSHRMVMRCYVKVGERAQALRQYRLCEELLHRQLPRPLRRPRGRSSIMCGAIGMVTE